MFVNCTGNMTIMFFTLFSKHLLDCPVQERLQFSSGQDHLYAMFCFSCDEILSLGCIMIDLHVLTPLNMTCTLYVKKFFYLPH